MTDVKQYLPFVTFLPCFQLRINIKQQKYWDQIRLNMRLPSIDIFQNNFTLLILVLRKFAEKFAVFGDSEIATVKCRITLSSDNNKKRWQNGWLDGKF
jgi:hypothetical protein